MHSRRGAGLRWRPLPKAEAPTEPTGETGYHPPAQGYAEHKDSIQHITRSGGISRSGLIVILNYSPLIFSNSDLISPIISINGLNSVPKKSLRPYILYAL